MSHTVPFSALNLCARNGSGQSWDGRLEPPYVAWIIPCVAIKRKKRPSLDAALRQAAKAGHNVKCAAIYADHIELKFDEPGFSATSVTPLEAWKEKKRARET